MKNVDFASANETSSAGHFAIASNAVLEAHRINNREQRISAADFRVVVMIVKALELLGTEPNPSIRSGSLISSPAIEAAIAVLQPALDAAIAAEPKLSE